MDSERASRLYSETETILVVDSATFLRLREQILSCESCNPEAETSVEMILDDITGSDPRRTSYFLGIMLRCPMCAKPIGEDGLVERGGRRE